MLPGGFMATLFPFENSSFRHKHALIGEMLLSLPSYTNEIQQNSNH